MGSDFWLVLRWWGVLFVLGACAFPLTKHIFTGRVGRSPLGEGPPGSAPQGETGWWDGGYFFCKGLGLALVTYLVYVFGTIHLFAFSLPTILLSLVLLFLGGLYFHRTKLLQITNYDVQIHTSYFLIHKSKIFLVLLEELFFFAALLLWSWVKGHEASIRALEKFMDFGFVRTILNTDFFPVPDMWYAGFPINYYYFGHIGMAILTKLSGIDLAYTFNLMLATLFALTVTMSFSIGYQLMNKTITTHMSHKTYVSVIAGFLTAFLVALAGNMQTLYAFTKGYTGENVKPFWELLWGIGEFITKLPEGLERYWYANATRFIPLTIHEFPSYSFVVSDLHGHVLSLPFVLLAIAFLVRMYYELAKPIDREFIGLSIFYGLLLSILLMTNALDGPIYLGLYLVLLTVKGYAGVRDGEKWWRYAGTGGSVLALWIIGSLPFLSHFQSFVSGLAVNCPLPWLANRKIGPFIFEGIEKCQHSPLWMWWLLWGFFVYCGIALIAQKIKNQKSPLRQDFAGQAKIINQKYIGFAGGHEPILIIFFLFSLVLVIFPEFFYFKDIYPAHFRSNTMFKLGYQAFIIFSIVAGYTIVTLLQGKAISDKRKVLFVVFLAPQLILVSIYPLFSVRSYFGGLRQYQGLYGLNWMITEYQDDYKALKWLENNAKCQVLNAKCELPVIVEADGDSYTDYNHFSAFAGLPSVVGWAVHEWLWRGSYDDVAPRREEVRKVYESGNPTEVRSILNKYHVRYIMVGKLERQKFTNLQETKMIDLANEVFRANDTVIYEVNI